MWPWLGCSHLLAWLGWNVQGSLKVDAGVSARRSSGLSARMPWIFSVWSLHGFGLLIAWWLGSEGAFPSAKAEAESLLRTSLGSFTVSLLPTSFWWKLVTGPARFKRRGYRVHFLIGYWYNHIAEELWGCCSHLVNTITGKIWPMLSIVLYWEPVSVSVSAMQFHLGLQIHIPSGLSGTDISHALGNAATIHLPGLPVFRLASLQSTFFFFF